MSKAELEVCYMKLGEATRENQETLIALGRLRVENDKLAKALERAQEDFETHLKTHQVIRKDPDLQTNYQYTGFEFDIGESISRIKMVLEERRGDR